MTNRTAQPDGATGRRRTDDGQKAVRHLFRSVHNSLANVSRSSCHMKQLISQTNTLTHTCASVARGQSHTYAMPTTSTRTCVHVICSTRHHNVPVCCVVALAPGHRRTGRSGSHAHETNVWLNVVKPNTRPILILYYGQCHELSLLVVSTLSSVAASRVDVGGSMSTNFIIYSMCECEQRTRRANNMPTGRLVRLNMCSAIRFVCWPWFNMLQCVCVCVCTNASEMR